MRRSAFTGLILACLLAVLWSVPASAHPGSTVLSIELHASTSIPIVVPADYGKPINEVDIANAPGFELQSAEAPDGWTAMRVGDTFVFKGGPITLETEYAVFAIRGVAGTKGELLFAVTTHSPDGSIMRYTGGRGTTNQGAVVYAGYVPGQPGSRGTPWLKIVGGVIVVVGLVGTAVLIVRRRQPVTGKAPRPT
jgi:hypothetical protein